MSKMNKNVDENIANIYSFDSEVNQFYNYSAWINPDATAAQKDPEAWNDPKTGGFCRVIAMAIESQRAALESRNYLAGFDVCEHAFEAYNDIMRNQIGASTREEMEEAARAWDYWTGAPSNGYGGALYVSPERAEMYLACCTCIPNAYTRPDGSVVSFRNTTEKEARDMIANAQRTFFYTVEEVSEYFAKIYKNHSLKKCKGTHRAIVIIHNLSYDFNNVLINTDFIKSAIADGRFKFLSNNAKGSYKSAEILADYKAKKDSDPVTYPALYIRDTWKLTNKGIEAIGNGHGYPKNPYTYSEIRDPGTLTDVDLEYNAKDTEIALLGLHDALSQLSELEELNQVPVSSNNIVSMISKHHYREEFEAHLKACGGTRKDANGAELLPGRRHMTAGQYEDFKPVTGGGLVFVNPEYAFKVWERGKEYNIGGHRFTVNNVKHIDLNSAHPSQVFKRRFPDEAPRRIDDTQDAALRDFVLEQIADRLPELRHQSGEFLAAGIANGFDTFDTLFPSLNMNTQQTGQNAAYFSGYAVFTLENVRARIFTKGGAPFTLPCMWSSKLQTKRSGTGFAPGCFAGAYASATDGENVRKVQGKVYSADRIKIKLTFEDLAIFSLFYDFDIIAAERMSLYPMGTCSDYLYKQFLHFGQKKKEYKVAHEITKAILNSKPYKGNPVTEADLVEAVNTPTFSEADRAAILSALSLDGIEDAERVAGGLLKIVKGQFNGIYGTAYQSLFRDAPQLVTDGAGAVEWMNDPEADASGTKYDDANRSGVDPLQGSYIAQWSRVDIALYSALVANMGGIPLYIATDSIYYLETNETDPGLVDVIKGNGSGLPYNKQTDFLFKNRYNAVHLGGMDFEADADRVAYTQALKIIVERDIIKDGKPETVTEITFSGCSADNFFEGYEGKEFARLLQPDGYCCRMTGHKHKTRKAYNVQDVDGSAGYVLESVAFVNNDSENPSALINRTAAYSIGGGFLEFLTM